jgi:FKBP-type peptidyl-prolyl cis-trans isomerase SlyD
VSEKIADNKVVSIAYQLTDEQGKIIDEAGEEQPFAFIFGTGSVVPGLESALDGKQLGDSFKVALAPNEAFGERDEALVSEVGIDRFAGVPEVAPGMQFQTTHEEHTLIVHVTDVDGDRVTIDGNHPLAGMTLEFDVTVVAVRAATPEEIDHGHVHLPGAHHH